MGVREVLNRIATEVVGVGYGDGRHQVEATATDSDPEVSGTRTLVLTDRRYKHQSSLQDRVDAELAERKTAPKEVSINVPASEVLGGDLRTGDTVLVDLSRFGLTETEEMRIRELSLNGDTGTAELQLSSRVSKQSRRLDEVAKGQELQDTGMLGSGDTNQDTHVDSIEGSSDGTYANAKPWIYDLLIPSDANLTGAADLGATKVELSFRLRAFRSYTAFKDATGNIVSSLNFAHRHNVGVFGSPSSLSSPVEDWYDEQPINFDINDDGFTDITGYLLVNLGQTDFDSEVWNTTETGTDLDVLYGIYEEAYSSPSVWIRIDGTDYGSDGSGGLQTKASGGTAFTTDQTGLDITSLIGSPGTWSTIEIWDDQTGVLGRVQGTIFTQYFLESN